MTTATEIDSELQQLEERSRALRAAKQRVEEEARLAEYQRQQWATQAAQRRRQELENAPALLAAKAEAERLHAEWERICEEGRAACEAIYDGPFDRRPAARLRAEELAPLARAALKRYEEASTHALNLECQLRRQLAPNNGEAPK